MVKDFDIEDLKVHRIQPEPKKKKLRLPVAGALPPAEEGDAPDEARAEGERTETLAKDALEAAVVDVLRTIFDPEIPLNVYDLGLIYGVDASESGDVEIRMTLTAPACPVAGQIVKDVATKVGAHEAVASAHVRLVWDPPWTKARMTDDALLELGLL
ncbi:MAG: iron-sulfur cluster assembly protein [Myxococcota bacterium]